MWGVPCGVGIALFAPDIVHHVVGDKWRFALPVLQILALTAGFNQFGFNWPAFYKAVNNTRPIAITGVVVMVAVIGLTVPLAYADGLRGYAIGMASATALLIAMRTYYLVRLFPSFGVIRHGLRAMLPTVPAAAVVLALRGTSNDPQGAVEAATQAVLFAAIVAAGTLYSERALLREVIGYVRGTGPAPTPA
jgi:O-antigen/teichoic acid export membrane protein